MDVVGGFLLADGRRAKALTGIDDHSRFCVSAFLMVRENARSVCDGLLLAFERYGLPGQVLTDNGKVFTGRFNQPPVEMIQREYGVTAGPEWFEHLQKSAVKFGNGGSASEVKMPRLSTLRARMLNHSSIWFIQEACLGV